MDDLTARIADDLLTASHKDGDIILHSEINAIEAICKAAINENYYDIQKILNGVKVAAVASSLSGALLSTAAVEQLQANDNKVPTAQQVKDYVDAKALILSSAILSLDSRVTALEGN